MIAPYGTWRSPITAEIAARAGTRLSSVALDGDDVYWLEGRPAEAGRQVVVRCDAHGRIHDVTPARANVRTRVHEYGGGAYLVGRGEIIYSELSDQRLYRLPLPVSGAGSVDRAPASSLPVALTPGGPWRYADGVRHPARPLLVCVREDHTRAGAEPDNTLVAIRLDDGETPGRVIVEGQDFYACPRISPAGDRLAWIAWRHPRMPWDGTELWVADLNVDGSTSNARLVAGGDTESIFQPGWCADGTLYFVSDRSGWWNVYRTQGSGRIEAVCPTSAEFGRPLWTFGMSTWAPAGPSRLVAAYTRGGRWRLATIDTRTGALTDAAAPIEPGSSIAATPTHAVCVAHAPTAPDAIVRVDLLTGAVERLHEASPSRLDAGYLSAPQSIDFRTTDGAVAHALFYPPRNADWVAPPGERPPLIVMGHGGPTAQASPALSLALQFWTSRGFAVVDVDYRGSTGYGREYREQLNARWGIVDVDDCLSAARQLVERGDADPGRLLIRGSSAGGYTTLSALTSHPGTFRAGASYFGVCDLEALARDTHKFEAHYDESLVGPYPARRDLYIERSPIHAIDRLASALILFQGAEDLVVPPAQARMMFDAVRKKGLPVALLMFEGEQHGFRKTETIRRCLEAELYFYGVVCGFVPADDLPPIRIDNVPDDSAPR